MILYIVLYKCVQRRKYINGFSQWGSMHELFLKGDNGGGGTVSINARFPNLIKSYQAFFEDFGIFLKHPIREIPERQLKSPALIFVKTSIVATDRSHYSQSNNFAHPLCVSLSFTLLYMCIFN